MTKSQVQKKKEKVPGQSKRRPADVAQLMLTVKGLQSRLTSMEKILDTNTRAFQDTMIMLDVRQGLLIRKLRQTVVGFDWPSVFAEYNGAMAVVNFMATFRGHVHRRKRAEQEAVPEGAVSFGGNCR